MTPVDKDKAEVTPVGELGYAAAAAELDAIVRELDEGLVDVDVLEVRFGRAIDIVEELDRRIRGARRARRRADAAVGRPRRGRNAGPGEVSRGRESCRRVDRPGARHGLVCRVSMAPSRG